MAQTAQDAPKGKLVVVIDDDPLVLEAMSGLLGNWGYQVAAAASEDAALAELARRQQKPDLIICDYRLADGRTGVDAIERLRKTFEIPAFLITADAALQRPDDARAAPYLLLHKPVSAGALRATLRQVLQGED